MKTKQRKSIIAWGWTSMAIMLALMLIVLSILPSMGWGASQYEKDKQIKLKARAASVQILHLIPGLKVTFANPLPEATKINTEQSILDLLEEHEISKEAMERLLEDKELTEQKLNDRIQALIDEAFEKQKAEEETDKYQYSLTSIEEYGYESPSKTAVPLGALAPEWARFPERVLVVQKTEKEEITAWEKEYEEDVLAISETADVSPSKAKSIITTLRTKGYSIFKEEIAEEAVVELLWFRSGWDETYPTTLSWKVCVEGTETNIITGYDPRGILYVRPIPDGKRIYVSAGYIDLKEQFKPKDKEAKRLEYELKGMEDKIKLLKEQMEEKEKTHKQKLDEIREELSETQDELAKEKEEDYKRDISKATWMDVKLGIVELKQFWMIGGGTGTYLGDMKVDNEMWGWQTSWGGYQHFMGGKEKGVILTNAHVAIGAIEFAVYVSEDKEVMWIIYPGYQYIRYTQDSDMFGTPSQVLCYDDQPILSPGNDCAIVVTTKVPDYKQYAAPLGDSDNVEQGDRVIMVGNPALLQKFATEGIISNKRYDLSKSMLYLLSDMPKSALPFMRNVSLWIDAPIGTGGTSGTAVWALDGKERGKVIALHAMGLGQPVGFTKPVGMSIDLDSIDLKILATKKQAIADQDGYFATETSAVEKQQIRLSAEKLREELFREYSFEDAMRENKQASDEFYEENETFKPTMEHHGKYVDIGGMSAGIPINKVKAYLQERGLDPDNFGWQELGDKHWWK